ncbi:MAG: Rrf2 family transcriptional regulator [Oscillatoriales cyanobacterium SM2_1_8]|nr:Rrf2 family transcriptional regulator [Oscillatoriales cyanobacterium SM2_1_8]
MELSSKLEYGLLALLELTPHYGTQRAIGTQEIAAKQSIPDRYLDQIFGDLKRAGITRSYRGPKGGYTLARSPQDISLLEVIRALECPSSRDRPGEGGPERRAIWKMWLTVQQEVDARLQAVTLEKLYRDGRQLETSRWMYYI